MCQELANVHPIEAFLSATPLSGDTLLPDGPFSLEEDVLVLVLYCGGCITTAEPDASAKSIHHLALCLHGLVDLEGQIGAWHQSIHGHGG